MNRAVWIALLSGLLFGAGLAVSGMADPSRVRAFLDVTGRWDPTLGFVMVGAMLPMIVAWRIKARLDGPLVGNDFHVPTSTQDRSQADRWRCSVRYWLGDRRPVSGSRDR